MKKILILLMIAALLGMANVLVQDEATAAPTLEPDVRNNLFFQNVEVIYRTTARCDEIGGCFDPDLLNDPEGWQRIINAGAFPTQITDGDVIVGIFNVQNIEKDPGIPIWAQDIFGDQLSGYFAQTVQAILPDDPSPGIEHLTLVSGADPWGILQAGEMYRIYVDDGAGFTAYETNGSIMDDIAKATNGTLWASLNETGGYQYGHIDIDLDLANFSDQKAFAGIDMVINDTGFAFTRINDVNENEVGGLCGPDGQTNCEPSALLNDVVGTSELETNRAFPTGSPWPFSSNDPFTFLPIEPPICGDGNVDVDQGETCDPPTGYCTGDTLPRTSCLSDSDCPSGETCGLPVAPAGGGDADRICRDGDGAPDECTYCGDGIEQPDSGEACDDGNDNNDDECRNDCTEPICGDNIVDPGENCDPPGSVPDPNFPNNVCRNGGTDYQCTYCGDEIFQPGAGEECDFNDPDAPENCNTNCELEPICGDGNVDVDQGETCDPPTGYCTGATLPRTACMIDDDCPAGETCGLPVAPAGGGDADRECRNGDGSPDECTYCGDGIEQPDSDEECDDGNDINDDSCTNDCMIVTNPGIDIEKVTDSPDNQNTTPPNFDNEDDPNGPGVPVIPAGSDITWTYKVTNTGDVAFAMAAVLVQDSVAAVNPVFDSVLVGNDNDILEPGEEWLYEATGIALDLLNPPNPLPDGVNIVEGCSNSFGDPQPPTATYMNTATVMADGLEDSDDSHYCGPPPECEVMVTKTCVAPPPGDGNDGCTPGYWKQTQHFVSWIGYSQDDDYETVFGVDASFTTTLLGAMEQGGGGEYALGRHAVAALLSASNPDVDYFTDVAGVIAIVQGAYATDNFENAKNLLDFQNNQGCPLNSDSDTNGDGDNGSATAQQIEADECEVIAGTAVTYNYEIENIGTVNISEVEVIDDPDPGDPFEVPGSPVMDVAPGEIVTLESTAVIDETTTNTVTVTGNPGPEQCIAMDTATVTVIDAGEGCTPGYWKQSQHFDSWVGFDPSDDFEAVFGVDASFTTTLLGAMNQGGGGEYALGRHAVAALLNASSPDVDYFTDVAGVIALVQNAYATGEFETAKDLLDLQNNFGCDLGRADSDNDIASIKIKEK